MEDFVERYIEARSAQRVVGAELDKMLSPNAIEQTAKRLGFWDRGAIVRTSSSTPTCCATRPVSTTSLAA